VIDVIGQRALSRALAALFCAVVLAASFLKSSNPPGFAAGVEAGSRDAHLSAGLRHHEQGALDAALREYSEAARVDPSSALAYYDIGVVQYEKKNIDAALAAYERAVALDPRFADAHFNLGFLKFHDRNDPTAAAASFSAAIAANPQMAKAYYELGLTYQALGMIDRARAMWELALKIEPAAYRDAVSARLAASQPAASR
jgi:tetratricopeptide (TPR) repeat protein